MKQYQSDLRYSFVHFCGKNVLLKKNQKQILQVIQGLKKMDRQGQQHLFWSQMSSNSEETAKVSFLCQKHKPGPIHGIGKVKSVQQSRPTSLPWAEVVLDSSSNLFGLVQNTLPTPCTCMLNQFFLRKLNLMA